MQLIPSYALPLPSSSSLPLLSIWLVPLDDDAPIQFLDTNKTLNLSFEFLYLMEFSINHLHYAWATEECGYSLHIPSFVSCTRSILHTAERILHLVSSSPPFFSALPPFSSSPLLPAASYGLPLSCGLPLPPGGQ